MKITCLVENTSIDPNLTPRHGLSLFIETQGQTLLFDMGPDHILEQNARYLGIDLAGIDLAFLSHGHKDHGGGIGLFQSINPHATIFMTKGATDRFYAMLLGLIPRDIGLDTGTINPEQCRLIDKDTRVSDTISLFMDFNDDGFIPRGNSVLFQKTKDGKKKNDNFSHEMALLITENDKTFLFTGCSHSGITNMLTTVLERTGLEAIDHVIGGFHLFNPITRGTEPPHRLDRLANELSAFPSTCFHTGHCTGTKAFVHLKNRLKDQISAVSTGIQIDI